jgi:hypothetical protein
MKTKLRMTLLACVFLPALIGCEWPATASHYQVVTTADGKLYRLDNKSGDVHYITPESMTRLTESTQTLEVGQYYKMTDAKDDTKYLKYLGNGQFEKSKWAILKTP